MWTSGASMEEQQPKDTIVYVMVNINLLLGENLVLYMSLTLTWEPTVSDSQQWLWPFEAWECYF